MSMAEFSQDIAEIKETVQHIEKALFIGNGEPSFKEQLHTVVLWQAANSDVPTIARDSKKWIDSVTKIAWIFISAAVGLFLATSCGVFFGVIILLYNNGLFKIP